VQRKNAQFWTEIADDVGNLLEPIDESIPVKKEESELAETHKSRSRASGNVDHVKKIKAKKSKASTGTKPSKRGYKWPTP
jgi:hypothetical protein